MSTGVRRLAAIMYTDMVGYTALGQRDESLALAVLEEQRRLIRPILTRHNGREVKTMGDGFLVEFASSLEAVRCAYDIQRAARELNFSLPEGRRIHLRAGVHVGDVVESEGDISGDAVNVASRIEAAARDGGVCLSRQAYDHVRTKFELPMRSIGERQLKNVELPVELFEVVMPWQEEDAAVSIRPESNRIAVLPFENFSPDPNDEYFADGMTEELIDRLAQVRKLKVISRTSVMGYKRTRAKASEIGKELGVMALTEGSVRKSGNRIRVTVQLIDARTEEHLWSSRYDRDFEDVFGIQSEIAEQVTEALKIELLPEEKTAIEKKTTENSDAHALYLKGRYYWNERTREGNQKAITYFGEAIKRDPNYALPYFGLADCYAVLENWGLMPTAETSASIERYTTKALELDDSLAEAHLASATNLRNRRWKTEDAEREFKRAIELKPSLAMARQWYANLVLGSQGRREEAIAELREAKRLDPLSPIISANLGDQLLLARRYDEAKAEYTRILEVNPEFAYARTRLGLALLTEGRYDEGIAEMERATASGVHDSSSDLIFAYEVAGRKDDARRFLKEVEQSLGSKFVSSVDLAMSYAAAGENEKAIGFLQKAADERSNQLIINLQEPHFDGLRSDPRFKKICTAVGSPNRSWWRDDSR